MPAHQDLVRRQLRSSPIRTSLPAAACVCFRPRAQHSRESIEARSSLPPPLALDGPDGASPLFPKRVRRFNAAIQESAAFLYSGTYRAWAIYSPLWLLADSDDQHLAFCQPSFLSSRLSFLLASEASEKGGKGKARPSFALRDIANGYIPPRSPLLVTLHSPGGQ